MKNKIIMMDSDEAAKFATGIEGWVSSDGIFFGSDKKAARYHGCTHRKCIECGVLTLKAWTACDACRKKNEVKRYAKREKKVWDGNAPLYSEKLDQYFYEALDNFELDTGNEWEDLRMLICEPVFLQTIHDEYWIDDLPEDGDLPQEIIDAVEVLNAKLLSYGPVSWVPGKYSAVIET